MERIETESSRMDLCVCDKLWYYKKWKTYSLNNDIGKTGFFMEKKESWSTTLHHKLGGWTLDRFKTHM